MKVSILLLTINRYDETNSFVRDALKNAGIEFDLCVTDNGSEDKRVIELIKSFNPVVHNINKTNEGTAQSLNRMIKQNPSDYYVFIGNDIEMPKDWLKQMVETAERIPQSGVVGINWRPLQYDVVKYNDVEVWHTNRTFGTMLVSQSLRDELGNFCEEYGTYGLWDSDYSIRAQLINRPCYYIKDLTSTHEGNDVHEVTPYRKMKDESIRNAQPIFMANNELYNQGLKLKQ